MTILVKTYIDLYTLIDTLFKDFDFNDSVSTIFYLKPCNSKILHIHSSVTKYSVRRSLVFTNPEMISSYPFRKYPTYIFISFL